VEPGEDAVAADEGMLVLGELGAEELIERALLLGGERVVAGAFAGVVPSALSADAPGLSFAGRKSSGEEASVDRGRWSLECLGDLGDRFPGFVAADGIGEVPGHGARLARSGDGDA
jgi:hypothetical protein